MLLVSIDQDENRDPDIWIFNQLISYFPIESKKINKHIFRM